MKRLLALVLVGTLTAGAASAQVSAMSDGRSMNPRVGGTADPNGAPPVTNPEPITLIALAGGAAAAGGLLRKRKRAQ